MRYTTGCQIMVPYIDMDENGESSPAYARMTFKGDVDRRRVKRELRKWVKRQVGRSISGWELQGIMKSARAL